MTRKIKNVYLGPSFSVASIYEANGPLREYFDFLYEDDFYFGSKTFEEAEEKMLSTSILKLIEEAKLIQSDIDYLISGDLENQIAASCYAAFDYNIPFLGIFSACATFGEGLGIAASLIEGHQAKNIIVSTSSHNMVAERQFRNPTEYGAIKKLTTTFTSTGAASLLLTNKKTKLKISSITIGEVCDAGINDVNNMGGVMAIAAADTIKKHLSDLKIKPDYYDLILTGDLGFYGKEILTEYLKEKNIDISKNHQDCGLILYDRKKQPVYAGASGPGTGALVLSAYILKEMIRGVYDRVLFVPTGALFSPTKIYNGKTIPSIAHAIAIEVVK